MLSFAAPQQDKRITTRFLIASKEESKIKLNSNSVKAWRLAQKIYKIAEIERQEEAE